MKLNKNIFLAALMLGALNTVILAMDPPQEPESASRKLSTKAQRKAQRRANQIALSEQAQADTARLAQEHAEKETIARQLKEAEDKFEQARKDAATRAGFPEPDPKESARELKEMIAEKGGTINASALVGKVESRTSLPVVPASQAGSMREELDKLGGSLDNVKDALAKERTARVPTQSSLFAKLARNKLKVLAGLIVLTDLAQALWNTPKEELKDKSFTQQAQVVGEKSFILALARKGICKAKNGMNVGLEATLNLKQRAQDYLLRKNN